MLVIFYFSVCVGYIPVLILYKFVELYFYDLYYNIIQLNALQEIRNCVAVKNISSKT